MEAAPHGDGGPRMQRLTDAAVRGYGRLPPPVRALALRRPLRRAVLAAVFRMMPRRFDSARGASLAATVHWRVGGDQKHGPDEWQLRFEGGRCHVGRALDREPTTTLTLDDHDFLDLVTGQVSGPMLFLRRKLQVSGDLTLAIRLPTLLRVPGAPRT